MAYQLHSQSRELNKRGNSNKSAGGWGGGVGVEKFFEEE